MAPLTYRKEPYYNACRLPARAKLYLDDIGVESTSSVGMEGLFIDSDYEGVPRDRLEAGA
jgi:hypothetical protein